jgi:3-hydroxymyristoyl/3-hydroxydecanoyl-(acyl carrier protein) dehydratase
MTAPMHSALEIAADHPAYAGHFPAMPVLPGAVLIDAVLGAVHLARHLDLTQWRIGVAKFSSAVRPGEPLSVEHEMSNSGAIRFTIRSSNRCVASGTLVPAARA